MTSTPARLRAAEDRDLARHAALLGARERRDLEESLWRRDEVARLRLAQSDDHRLARAF
jgi:hypothetical protein